MTPIQKYPALARYIYQEGGLYKDIFEKKDGVEFLKALGIEDASEYAKACSVEEREDEM